MTESDFTSAQEEITEIPSENMAQLLEADFSPRTYQRGEMAEGEVVQADADGILVSVGLKMEGIVPPQEMRSLTREQVAQFKPGDSIWVTVLGTRGAGEMALLSVDHAYKERNWRELRQLQEDGAEISAKITGYNRGGLEVDYQGLRGFVPYSQMAPISREDNRDEVLSARVGQVSQFHVLELDQYKERLILTERAIWQQRRNEARQRFMEEMAEGSVIKGKVTSVRAFGAFVNLGEVEGLIHISELSWGMVKSASEVVKVGDEVSVYVLKVDQESGRISLSIKRVMPEPWETVPERFSVDEVVEGTVARLTEFGAFVNLEPGVDGLVHISEISTRRVTHPKEVLNEGQHVPVKILGIDAENRRISLSYKQAVELDAE